MKKFSLFKDFEINFKTIENIYNAIKITLGPTGKNGIILEKTGELKFITNGSILLKALEFPANSANVILKLFEQASIKTFNISGDGSTTTTLLTCELLKISLKYIINGYNSIFLNSGLKKIGYFLIEKVLEFSVPVENQQQLNGILSTNIGKKINADLLETLQQSLP
jgi:chaperonin GroEL